MQPVSIIEGTAAAFARPNVDTDVIIRVERLMRHGPGELGPYCFESLRYRPDGSESPDFALNQPRARGASILLAGENFGCGSSREAAVWSLMDSGIRCIIAPSFGDIFYNNSLQNGLLPVALPAVEVHRLATELEQAERPRMSVDLLNERIVSAAGREISFAIDPEHRSNLLEGLDEIGVTARSEPAIVAFQSQDRGQRPWIYDSSQRTPRVLMLAGDGIGPEIMAQSRRVVAWFTEHRGIKLDLREELYGIDAWKAHGVLMRKEIWEEIEAADAILFGATGSPEYKDIPSEQWLPDNLLRIRKRLDLFGNLRPVRLSERLQDMSTLRPEVIAGADLMIVRELGGGLYFGTPRGIEELPTGGRRAVNSMVYTTAEIERIARIAFELARGRRGQVCSVDKANVLEVGMLWREVVQAVHDAEYPDVQLQHMYVDNAAMQLVRAPRQFDVLLTENLFGDILSDCAAMVAGSIGMLPSASLGAIDAAGHRRALYEPIHGSAPDIAGQGIANPLGAILSFGLCLQFTLNLPQEARFLQRAVDAAVEAGARTADIVAPGIQPLSTQAMGTAVIAALNRLAAESNQDPAPM